MSSAADLDLGVVNGVTVAVACTHRPRLLGVDSLVVSVGDNFGHLGQELSHEFPHFAKAVAEIDLAGHPRGLPRKDHQHPVLPARHDRGRHLGLQGITGQVTLPDLVVFQRWAPRVRRFSYFSG